MTTAMLEPTTRVDGDEPSRALGEMPYGLYIVGSKSDEGPNGMMADWVMQVAFAPRLVAVSIENDAHTLANINRSGVFNCEPALCRRVRVRWKVRAAVFWLEDQRARQSCARRDPSQARRRTARTGGAHRLPNSGRCARLARVSRPYDRSAGRPHSGDRSCRGWRRAP